MGVPVVAGVLPAAGAVGELPHAVKVTHVVSRMAPITDAVERAIADPLFPRPLPPTQYAVYDPW